MGEVLECLMEEVFEDGGALLRCQLGRLGDVHLSVSLW